MLPITYTGKVISTKDPDAMGRVQVKLEGFTEELELPWLRLLNPYASASFGWVFLPEADDEVLVLKGAGDNFNYMFVLGSLYNGVNKPSYSDDDGKNITKQIITRSGHEFTFCDKDGEEKITLQTPEGKLMLEMDQKGVKITIQSEDKIDILAEKGTVTVKADKVAVEGKSSVSIKGGQKVEVTSDTKVTVKAAQVEVKGDAKVSIKAAMVEIN